MRRHHHPPTPPPYRVNGHRVNGHRPQPADQDSWLDTTGPHHYQFGADISGEQLYLPPSAETPTEGGLPGRHLDIPAAQHTRPRPDAGEHPPTPVSPAHAAPQPHHTPPANPSWASGGGAALAAMFAADLLSWSQDDPHRWAEVIHDYLPGCDDPRALGWWNGTGRQRVDLAIPGDITTHDGYHATVEVLVRITPYSRSGNTPLSPATTPSSSELPIPGRPSTAPAPAAAGWRGETAYRARLLIPITLTEAGVVVIDQARLQGQP